MDGGLPWQGIRNGELALEYQPIYSLSTGRVTKVEALLRRRSPGLGAIAPSLFVPAMEESGLGGEIGGWVLDRACAQAAEWKRLGIEAKVCVNVSPRQLERGDLADLLARSVERHGGRPQWLELELTEHTLMRDLDASKRTLSRLAALGATVVIDDFGSGHSSLARLAELDVHGVKVDRLLAAGAVRGSRKGAILDAVVALCDSLGLGTTIEGLEEPDQLDFLRRFPRVEVQGFLLGRPSPASAIPRMCRRGLDARLRTPGGGPIHKC